MPSASNFGILGDFRVLNTSPNSPTAASALAALNRAGAVAPARQISPIT